MLVERHVVGPVKVELLDSAAQGSENCVFRIEIEDPSPPRR
jgi:predicted hydrocarbon binding protein